MNRVGLGLAVGAGYVLGRTKKMKMAFALGSLVAGKRMNLSPKAVADLVNQQLRDNPQFKEIGDQLRQDLRGVGKAASGAMVERQMSTLADRLHGRTAQVRDQLEGVVPGLGGPGDDEQDEQEEEPEEEHAEAEDEREDGEEAEDEEAEKAEGDEEAEEAEGDEEAEGKSESARKGAVKKAPAKKAPAKKTAQKAPAKKASAKKTAARKTAEKKTARAGSASRAARARLPKGGGDR